MPLRAFVFDAYGTLFDVHAAISRHRDQVGPDADRISEIWRAKQLEYSWTLTLMGGYQDFWQLTEKALDFALKRFPDVDSNVKVCLLDAYFQLHAFPDARETLAALKAKSRPTAILSNGSPAMLRGAVEAASLATLLDHVLSVDELKLYKPRPEVYGLAINALKMPAQDIAFVSSNRWDIAGATKAGFKAYWINRGKSPNEYDGLDPQQTLRNLKELLGLIA